MSSGTAKLYGRFETIFHPSPPSSEPQSIRNASPSSTRMFGKGSTTSRSAGISARSNSTASTSAPDPASATVSAPTPAPISTTLVPGPASASDAINRVMFESMRKF